MLYLHILRRALKVLLQLFGIFVELPGIFLGMAVVLQGGTVHRDIAYGFVSAGKHFVQAVIDGLLQLQLLLELFHLLHLGEVQYERSLPFQSRTELDGHQHDQHHEVHDHCDV